MAKRDSNIALDLTGDEPAVQRRSDGGETTDGQPTGEATSDDATETGVKNPDGSITVSGTPKESPGEETAENVPADPLAAEIQRFEDEVDHPEDWTDLERKAVAKQRRCPDLSVGEISDQLGISKTVIRRGKRKVAQAELAGKSKVRAAFQECTSTQQIVIAAGLAGAPEYTTSDLAQMADCKHNTINSARRRFQPLTRRLDQVGLPNQLVPEPILNDLAESDDTEQTTDDPAANDPTESESKTETEQGATESAPANDPTPEPPASQPAIEDIRQFVAGLREAANTEHSLSDSATVQQGTAARQATCEAILTYIETTHSE